MRWLNSKPKKRNRGFTLVELMIVITIIGILTALSAYVLTDAATDAKAARTKSLIARINLVLLDRWESYETRQLQIKPPPGLRAEYLQGARLWGMRDLLRMEMPDRMSDVTQGPVTFPITGFTGGVRLPQASLQRRYLRRVSPGWTAEHEGAECLYLILDGVEDEFGGVLEHFKTSEIGDTDNDGMKEILDAWGNPIEFIRWPAGYESPIQAADPIASDPFDPFKRDNRWGTAGFQPHVILPLIYSAGANKEYGIRKNVADISTAATSSVVTSYKYVDPYLDYGNAMIGSPIDNNGAELDNIDNQYGVVE